MVIWWTPVLAKSFVNKKSGDLTLKIDYASFIGWNEVCPLPDFAAIRVNVTATPVGGGTPFVVGEQTFSPTPPSTPGRQPDASVDYVIAAGTLSFGVDYVIEIIGTCEVRFPGTGPGTGLYADTATVESCIVQPTPLDENTPRLGICCLTKEDGLVSIAERGDQRATYYLISNNDPKHAVTIDLGSSGFQVANLPDGFSVADVQAAYDAGAASISSPVEGADTFVGFFEGDVPANGIVPNPADPGAVDPLTITQEGLVLAPFECRMICIVTRSNGMCADGSCSRRNLKVTGEFADGSSALACAISAHAVEAGAPRQAPRCLYTDTIKVGPDDQVLFSRGHFGNRSGPIPFAETHFGGNVTPAFQPFPGESSTELRGANFPSPEPFPDQASDTIAEEPFLVDSFFDISYEIEFFGGGLVGPPTRNRTTVFGIGQLQQGVPVDVPVVLVQPAVPVGPQFIVDSFFDVGTGNVLILDASTPEPQQVYNGPISELQQFANESSLVNIPPGTCRTISKSGNTAQKYSVLAPHNRTFVLGKKDRPSFFDGGIPVVNGQDTQPSPWDAVREGIGVQPRSPSGTDTVPIELVALDLQSVDPIDVDIFGKKNRVRDFHSWVCVSCPGGLNIADSPFLVRVVNLPGKPGIKKDFKKAKSFKKVPVGNTTTGMITLRNKGKGPVSFRPPATLPAPFSWVSDVSGFHTVYPKGQLQLEIAYTPVGEDGKTKGKDKVTAEVLRSDKEKPLKLKLKGDWIDAP